jgi:hypothetical protein
MHAQAVANKGPKEHLWQIFFWKQMAESLNPPLFYFFKTMFGTWEFFTISMFFCKNELIPMKFLCSKQG